MRKFMQGVYTPQNPDKYKGPKQPVYRSSWEYDFFLRMLDLSEGVLSWSSEPFPIPYQNPLTGKQTVYIPDFLVTLISGGQEVTKLVEIKPVSETFLEYSNSNADAQQQARNTAKWGAAAEWCARHGAVFEIYTEKDMFAGGQAIMPTGRNRKPNLIGTKPKKTAKPRVPRKPKSIMQVLAEKAGKLKAAQNRRGKLSTGTPKVRRARARKVKRA